MKLDSIKVPLFCLLFSFFLGCATTYTSIDVDALYYEVIVGEEATVFNAGYQAIQNCFPNTIATTLAGDEKGFSFFTQPLLDRTTYKFVFRKVLAVTHDNFELEGYSYSIDSYGTQFFVNQRYVEPLIKEFKRILMEKRITLAKASRIKFLK